MEVVIAVQSNGGQGYNNGMVGGHGTAVMVLVQVKYNSGGFGGGGGGGLSGLVVLEVTLVVLSLDTGLQVNSWWWWWIL